VGWLLPRLPALPAQGLGVALARHRLAQEELASGALVRPFDTRAIDLGVAYWMVRPPGKRAA